MTGHVHLYDLVSGYCRCGLRDEGRLYGPGGAVWRPGTDDTPDFDTAAHLERLRQQFSTEGRGPFATESLRADHEQ